MAQEGSNKLKIAIIGAGLAGALSARVLREAHNVTLYERSDNPREAGAAINIGPNGVRILDQLGFDRQKAGSMPVALLRIWSTDGELKMERRTDYYKTYGGDWLFHHRADLRNEFLRLATEESGVLGVTGEPGKIRWGTRVESIDTEEGKLVLENGEVVTADLIIAADGIKTIARTTVVGDAAYSTARPSGLSAFRFTLETSRIQKACGELPDMLDSKNPVGLFMVYSFDASKRSVVMYPCRNFELLNFVCICPDSSLNSESSESWTAPGDRDELLHIFKDFPEWVLRLLRISENVKLWQLRDQDPLPSYIKGRVVLVGDAAHPMTPLQGQGGTQAVEDAEGFRIFLKPGVGRGDVPDLLRDYDSVRRPRASQIQENTRQAQDKRSAEDVMRFDKYNWTYPGVLEGLRRVQAGKAVVDF